MRSSVLTDIAVFSGPALQAATHVVAWRVVTRDGVDARLTLTLVRVKLTAITLPAWVTQAVVAPRAVHTHALMQAR